MVKTANNSVQDLMHAPDSIRNISVIAHVDHGKTTLTDSLLAAANYIREDQAGSSRKLDFMKEEEQRGITIKSTGITMPFQHRGENLLLNLIDSPGHVDFSSEVTAALRVTDGALVVVDCVSGASVQTDTVLRQALTERIKPVLVINKIDRMFLELQMEPEEIYQKLVSIIDDINSKIADYSDHVFEDYILDPLAGNVAFTSAKTGWGFTLQQFASMLRPDDPSGALRRLWGEHYRNEANGKWTKTNATGKKVRGFVALVIKPLIRLHEACMETDYYLLAKTLLPPLGVELTSAEWEKTDKHLLRAVMRKFLPCHLPLVAMVSDHLPSPITAQKYRAELLYTGQLEDATGQAIKNCDPDGPLTIFISKMIPEDERAAHFTAFGRVLSGTARPGDVVHIFGPNYKPGKAGDCYKDKKLSSVFIMMGGKKDNVDNVPVGNTVALSGIDKYLIKTGTIVSDRDSAPLLNMSFSVAPVVRQAVEPKKPQDLQRVADKLRLLCKTDPLVEVHMDRDTGQYIIAGAGELHLAICVSQLERMLGNVAIVVKEPVVTLNETVTAVSDGAILVKSPNKHNRLYGRCEPLVKTMVEAMVEGDLNLDGGEDSDNTRRMTADFGWDKRDARAVWCYGPQDGISTNVLVDQTKGVAYFHEIRDHVSAGFQWATSRGALCDEPMRGMRLNLTDGMLHADAIHRGAAQLLGPMRNLVYATQLTAEPRLMEPVFKVEISAPTTQLKGCYQVLQKRRAQILPQRQNLFGDLRRTTIDAFLPVIESFGFDADLRSATGGEAFAQMAFDHWEVIDSDPLTPGTRAHEMVTAVRARKGLPPKIPTAEDFMDVL